MDVREQLRAAKGELLAFVTKYKSQLPIIGLFVVFLTFIIKDGFREHLKDMSDDTKTAITMFQIQERSETAESRIEDSLQSLKSKEDESYFTKKLLVMGSTLEELGNLSDAIHNKADDKKAQEVSDEYAKVAKRVKTPYYYAQDTDAIDIPLRIFSQHVRELENSELQHVFERKKHLDSLYSIITWVSYFLYALGWGIAFLGKIVGADVGIP